MSRIFGWAGFLVLAPFIACGVVAYFVSDACVYGWKMAEQWLEDWDD